MTRTVDFVQGIDALAPGLSRAQNPLLAGLRADRRFVMRPVRFSTVRPGALFPFLYGPLPLWLDVRRPDLFHIANSWYAHLIPLLNRPTIVTCHDLIQLNDLEHGRAAIKPHRRFHLRAALRGMLAARFIVCDSHAVASQVRARAPQNSDRIRVVYLGVAGYFAPGSVDMGRLSRLGVEPPYVLYVGSEQERKNLLRLVAALAEARRRVPGLRFVKVGGHQTREGRARLHCALRESDMEAHSVILENVGDDDLVALYRGAAVTALVSLEEGFGFPALEAMACGCPTVVSNRDSLPEVVGDAGLVVDPLDARSVAEAVELLVCDRPLASELSARGLARGRFFTWERASRAYGDLYQEALDCP